MAEPSQASSKENLPAPAGGAGAAAQGSAAAAGSTGTPNPAHDKTDLQVFLQYTLPKFLAKNVDRLLLVLVVLAAGYWAWNYRNSAIRQEIANVQAAVASAYDTLQVAKSRGILLAPNSAEADVKSRLDVAAAIEGQIDVGLTSERATPLTKAMALATRGDLNLTLAQLPETAWPSSGPLSRKPSGFLDRAEEAYKQILTNHADLPAFAVPALLSLGSIAESRQDWANATKYYDMVLNDANARPAHKQLAEARKAILPQLQVAIVPLRTTTQPSGTASASTALPNVQPRNIEPTTSPAMSVMPTSSPTTTPTR
jgi:hypothetical protein